MEGQKRRDDPIVECETCGLKIIKYNLKRHIDNIHLKKKEFQCEHCDFACNQQQNLKMHSCYLKQPNAAGIVGMTSEYSAEYAIQIRLEKELNGRKITCPFGKIDIMTNDTIIEIKKWAEHKKAIGQILGYSVYFPSYKKRIHFFGSQPTATQMQGITDVCAFYGIEVTNE